MSSEFILKTPFFIDTDGYTDRDRAMFAAGFEFAFVLGLIIEREATGSLVIMRENESRLRMGLGKHGVRVTIQPIDECETHSTLTIERNPFAEEAPETDEQ